ncbi:hypothetical protein GIB67_023360, partial [Kingdonia uniflora]
NPRKKIQETSLELNPRFFPFFSLTLFSCTKAFNIHSLFIGFSLGHLRNTHHEIIYRFRSNLLQNEFRNKQTEPKSFERVMRSLERLQQTIFVRTNFP